MYLAWTGLFSVCFIMVFKSEFASKICNEKKKKRRNHLIIRGTLFSVKLLQRDSPFPDTVCFLNLF